MKTAPLSDTIVSGRPWVAKDHRSLSIVAAAVAVSSGKSPAILSGINHDEEHVSLEWPGIVDVNA